VEGGREKWSGKNLSVMKMGSLGGTLELVQGLWIPHIAVNTNRLDELSWGHEVVDRPKHRVCFIQDQDGNWIELVEEK
jgi:hypothetical protein